MADDFVKMLERFVEYRKSLSMIQVDISEQLGITQSRFSKNETGSLAITNDILTGLYLSGWDIDYIITGVKRKSRPKTLQDELIEFSEENEIFKLIYWALYNYCVNENILEEYDLELKILYQLCHVPDENHTVFYILRKLIGLSQEECAKLFTITVKKCRKFEKGRAYPDADMLRHVYSTTKCRPSLLLEIKSVKWDIIENIWSGIDREKQLLILNVINNGIVYYKNIGQTEKDKDID